MGLMFLTLVTLATLACAALAGSDALAQEAPKPVASVTVALNEILADPPPESPGDANGDGVRDASDDEFVEIHNFGPVPVDIAGWTLLDSTAVRHVFPDSVPLLLQPGEFATVFGGGTPTGFEGVVMVASTGRLQLNNTNDRVALLDRHGDVVDVHAYRGEGDDDVSMVRVPDGWGEWVRAGEDDTQAPFSPQRWNGGPTRTVRETWGGVKARVP